MIVAEEAGLIRLEASVAVFVRILIGRHRRLIVDQLAWTGLLET